MSEPGGLGTSIPTREIGATGVHVTELGFGGGGLGEFFVKVPEAEAEATLEAAWRGGVRYFDTAPLYGAGLSELRIGRFLRTRARSGAVVSTKVGRVMRAPADPAGWTGDGVWAGGLPFEHVYGYGYDAVMRSYEDSLLRLGRNQVDLVVLHDLTSRSHTPAALGEHMREFERSGWRALQELRTAGVVRGLGAGANSASDVAGFLAAFDLDFVIVAGHYTLLDQSALLEALPLCERRGVSVIVGAGLNSGILGQGPVPGARYDYGPAPPEVVERTARIEAICARHGVTLLAAAIQFPLGHPAVRSVLTGPISPAEATASCAAHAATVPADVWEELRAEGLLGRTVPVPA
jgi:D-threo-aldose 1-dehydrogenase